MWWNFVARVSRFASGLGLHHLVQLTDLSLQQIDLLLLTKSRTVQFFDMIFSKSEFDFEFSNSGFHTGPPGSKSKRAPRGALFDCYIR